MTFLGDVHMSFMVIIRGINFFFFFFWDDVE